MNNDPECQKFLADYEPKTSKELIEKAIKSLDSIDRSKLKHDVVIDVMRANDYGALEQFEKAREIMFAVLKHQPLLTGMYHDLGMNYMTGFRMDGAWTCFNLADRIKPGFYMMAPIHKLESKMESELPDFF